MIFSTIAAVSTPRGKGGVALLRVSGPEAFSIVGRVFRSVNGKRPESDPRRQFYGEIVSSDGETVLDDGLVCAFPGPHSFTGEDVAEICCHGGETVTVAVLEALLACGAVMAAPGEFSRRAFLNGKMTLTAAEGVADLLDAPTREAVILSSKAARGALSEKIEAVARDLTAASASLWAYLDYPEEDMETLKDDQLVSALAAVRRDISGLLDSFRTGRAVTHGVKAAVLGKPNAGKSTFFNALLGEDRSIVSEMPGTTRDYVDAPLRLGRVLLDLADTAGIRKGGQDPIEKIGIDRALDLVKDAELLFVLFDGSRPFDENDQTVLSSLREKRDDAVVIPIVTKADLPLRLDLSSLPFSEDPIRSSFFNGGVPQELVCRVEAAFISDETLYRRGAILTNARQKACLVHAGELIDQAMVSISSGAKDLATLDLEEALASLRETDGKSAGEAIINEVFARFCVGK